MAGRQTYGQPLDQVAAQLYDQNSTARITANDDSQRKHETTTAARRNQLLRFICSIFLLLLKHEQSYRKRSLDVTDLSFFV